MPKNKRLRFVKEPQPLRHALTTRGFEDMPEGFSSRVLILQREDGSVGLFLPLISYHRAFPYRSSSWQDTTARALGLFWDFCLQTKEQGFSAADVLRQFALKLRAGTFFTDGSDPTGLYWPSTSQARCQDLIKSIERFADWCIGEGNATASTIAADCVPLVSGTPEQATKLLMWSRLAKISMLQHIKVAPKTFRRSLVSFDRPATGRDPEPAKFFPPQHVERLLWIGHARPGHAAHPNDFWRHNVRDIMIALLDGWGGLRRSEGLHLWMEDVVDDPIDPGHALVVLNHPAESEVELFDRQAGTWRANSRKEFLRQRYGLLPRNEVKRGWYHVGWKGMALDRRCQARVFWTDPNAGALFLTLFLGYIRYVRREIMRRRSAMGGADHPFLFVSEEINAATGLVGEPYSEKAYERHHEAAVRRIGLPYAKDAGTTTHGLRHLYGRTLSDLKVPAQAIRMGLHHQSFMSQVVYTAPDHASVNEALRAAQHQIKLGHRPIAPLSDDTAAALLRLKQHLADGGPI
jgi:hypothetical protein